MNTRILALLILLFSSSFICENSNKYLLTNGYFKKWTINKYSFKDMGISLKDSCIIGNTTIFWNEGYLQNDTSCKQNKLSEKISYQLIDKKIIINNVISDIIYLSRDTLKIEFLPKYDDTNFNSKIVITYVSK